MPKKPVPLGYCKDCRWSREFPDEVKRGPFEYDCQAVPWNYEPVQEQGKVRDPRTGQVMQRFALIYVARPHRAEDFCSFFAPMPDASDGGNGDGDGDGDGDEVIPL